MGSSGRAARDCGHGMAEIDRSEPDGAHCRHYCCRPVMRNLPGRFPVLYLVHGSGDALPESWTGAGHANLILDNLIADRKATPMIVVMPAGHAVPFSAGRGGPVNNNDLFEQYLVKEVIPTIEGKYRIAAGARNRALAGLSMGGGHTIYTGFSHPELFGALGIFSPGLPRDFDTKFQSVLADPKSFNAKVGTVWIACGDNDTTVQYPRIKTWAESPRKGRNPRDLPDVRRRAHLAGLAQTASRKDFAPLIFTRRNKPYMKLIFAAIFSVPPPASRKATVPRRSGIPLPVMRRQFPPDELCTIRRA